MKKENYRIIAVVAILTLALFRLIPHPPNFTPILAMSIFAGMKFKNNLYSYIIPIMVMFISDIFIWLHSGMLVIYPTLLITTLIARNFNTINSASIISSTLFFITSNLQVWLISNMYGKNILGLIECYTAAIPFFGMTLISTFIYSYVLFLSFELLTKIPIKQRIWKSYLLF